MHSNYWNTIFNLQFEENNIEVKDDYEDLNLVIDLMYHGTVTVGEKQRDKFVELMDRFEINNCTGTNMPCFAIMSYTKWKLKITASVYIDKLAI